MQDIDSVIYDGAKPNPSIANVELGLGLLKENQCDFVVLMAISGNCGLLERSTPS